MKSDLLFQQLYETALFNPVFVHPALNRLLIVSGYASSAMGFHHLDHLRNHQKFPKVDLIYGMVMSDGISRSNHQGFQSLSKNDFPNTFSCGYLKNGEPVHAKVYIWCQDERPLLAFTGSANYTQTALLHSQRREVLVECNPRRAYDYFKSLRSDSIDCCDKDVSNIVRIATKTRQTVEEPILTTSSNTLNSVVVVTDKSSPFWGLEKTVLSLLDNDGNVPARSGLNWGQRPELSRDPDQAYLAIRGDLRRSSFFPAIGVHFTVLTDDNVILQVTRAQQEGKAIQTPHDNSEIGKYFRARMGLPSGAFVTLEDIQRYGRTTVDLYKLDGENFYLDFSVPPKR